MTVKTKVATALGPVGHDPVKDDISDSFSQVREVYDDIAAIIAATDVGVGTVVGTLDGQVWDIVATSTYAVDEVTVHTLTGVSGQAVRRSRTFADIADLKACTAPASGAGTRHTCPGMDYEEAEPAATDHHETNTAGTKLYESGVNYTTRARFDAAVTRGAFTNADDGLNVMVGGKVFVYKSGASHPNMPANWREPWMRQVNILTSDHQPRTSAEVTRMQGVYDAMATLVPNPDWFHCLGDLVDEGSQNNTGAAPLWGFPEYKADIVSRVCPWDRVMNLPGNHGRDGTGAGSHETAWSMRSYRQEIGPEYYYTLQGNLLNLYAGDMGGSTGGVITDAVVDWIRQVCGDNRDKNIVWHLHHPLSGTYQGVTEASDADKVQISSSRLSDILDDIAADADNIVAVFYGHVGSSYQFNREFWHGTPHVQIGMHLPSNVDAGRNDQFYSYVMEQGATSFTITQWDATAGAATGNTETITLKYPLELAPGLSFDGRKQHDGTTPLRKPLEIMQPVSDLRYDNAGTWEVGVQTHPLLTLGMEDTDLDDIEKGFRFGIRLKAPGATLGSQTYDEAALNGVSGYADIMLRNTNGVDENGDWGLVLPAISAGATEDRFEILPSSHALKGLYGDDVRLSIGNLPGTPDAPVSSPSFSTTEEGDGFMATPNGRTYASTTSLSAFELQRKGSDGSLVNFYRGGAAKVGSISVTSSATSFNTISDGRFKDDLQDFDGLAFVELMRFYDYRWIPDGTRAFGTIAQELVKIVPTAVLHNAETDTWSVDNSKLVPFMGRAIQQQQDVIADLTRRIEALEAGRS